MFDSKRIHTSLWLCARSSAPGVRGRGGAASPCRFHTFFISSPCTNPNQSSYQNTTSRMAATTALPPLLTVEQQQQQKQLARLEPCIRAMVEQHEVLGDDGQQQQQQRRFRIDGVLDEGGFATVLRCTDLSTGQQVAAKVAVDLVSDDDGAFSARQRAAYQASMRHEHGVYAALAAAAAAAAAAGGGGGANGRAGSGAAAAAAAWGVPAVYFAGGTKRSAGDAEHPRRLCLLSVLVMQMLGPPAGLLSLGLRAYRDDAALLVNHGLGMLRALRCMHAAGYVHRDVKPDNFCLPLGHDTRRPGRARAVFVVDMGMALRWRDAPGFSWDDRSALYTGTPDYSSTRALRGHHATPADDLEALGVSLLEMATGDVPFDLVHASEASAPLKQERLLQMADCKEALWRAKLADDGGAGAAPPFVRRWMRHLRSLPPRTAPAAADYAALEAILRSAAAPAPAAAEEATAVSAAASAAWSCAPAAGGKRGAVPWPLPLAAASPSSGTKASAMSEAATAVQSKRFRLGGAGDDAMVGASGGAAMLEEE